MKNNYVFIQMELGYGKNNNTLGGEAEKEKD